MLNSRVPSPRVPRVPAGGFPVPPPRARLAVGLDTPPPWRGRCRAPDSPCGFGHGLSGRQQRRYRRRSPQPHHPPSPLSSKPREGGQVPSPNDQSTGARRRWTETLANRNEEVKLGDPASLGGGDCSNRQTTRPVADERRLGSTRENQSVVS